MGDGDTPKVSTTNSASYLQRVAQESENQQFWRLPSQHRLRLHKAHDRVSSVMTYDTEIDSKALCGEMFLADRFVVNTKGKLPAIMLYKGLKESKNGREYHDVRVVNGNRVRELLNKTA